VVGDGEGVVYAEGLFSSCMVLVVCCISCSLKLLVLFAPFCYYRFGRIVRLIETCLIGELMVP
jgi:hypothetical protein